MARSGTTLVTSFLNSLGTLGSPIYQDMPFINTPLVWNYFSKFYYGKNRDFKRYHGDDLVINLNSPDSFEEIFWINKNKNFDLIYKNFIKKIIYLRKSDRYLSKNNNLISRLNYLTSKFSDAKIIILYRNPLDTISSVVRVNQKIIDSIKIKLFQNILEILVIKNLDIIKTSKTLREMRIILIMLINYGKKKILKMPTDMNG